MGLFEVKVVSPLLVRYVFQTMCLLTILITHSSCSIHIPRPSTRRDPPLPHCNPGFRFEGAVPTLSTISPADHQQVLFVVGTYEAGVIVINITSSIDSCFIFHAVK